VGKSVKAHRVTPEGVRISGAALASGMRLAASDNTAPSLAHWGWRLND
jgi:hypothetical protein